MKVNMQGQQQEVLFQKIGNTWFVFATINDECVYSALPHGMDPHTTKIELFQVIEDHMKKVAGHQTKKATEVAA